jgi:hypothetical protein
MQTLNATGRTTGTTDEGPKRNNSGDCAFCGRPADGVDGVTLRPVCRLCGEALNRYDGDRLITGGAV